MYKQKVWKIYKVTQPRLSVGGYPSVVAGGDACVIYDTGSWSTSRDWLAEKGYHLTGFKTLAAARKFARARLVAVAVWRAEAIGRVALPRICSTASLALGGLDVTGRVEWPKGTVMFKKIRLIHRLVTPRPRLRLESP